MRNHEIATHRIGTEVSSIAASALPELTAERARTAAFMAQELSAITSAELHAYLKQIRALEMTRHAELLIQGAA